MNQTGTALITGASSGIGWHFAHEHAKRGGDAILVARNEKKLTSLKQVLEAQYQISAHVIAADLQSPGAAQEIYEKTTSQQLSVDVLINNAGFGGHGVFSERELADDLAMIQVNISALTALTHYYIKDMVARGHGKILNVSSTASFIPGPLQAVYYATKAFVTSFSQAIAQEHSDKGITVTALCPGAVKTGFAKAGNLEDVAVFEKGKSAESVAAFGYAKMEQGKLVAVNESGLRFLIDWVIPLLPRKLVLKMSRQSMEKK
ncbi:SDR family oxidoreductase [Alteromonas sp. KUL49]|uniref:SDR family NAD(P)-dependent oxidoreductase n=1 Tax=Alteromonas sp. KUL49 TaxID=2480798 RepID=UPI00102EE908|nr:SDR family oxidoreductase [Alteromonas sp. KUL49]TAP42552.1 SDR family oxidoreductase [Alteromonas sp. KUL49]GEA10186.1 short-chain dehydrogenase [Alteromonas sp. KUL49]